MWSTAARCWTPVLIRSTPPGPWVQRTSSADSIKLMVGVEFTIYDRTSKGGDKANTEQIQIQYAPTGSGDWQLFGNYTVTGSTPRTRRVSYSKDVPAGQYDVRCAPPD